MAFSDAHGAEFVGEPARFFDSLIAIQKGNLEAGIARMEELLEKWAQTGCRLRHLTCGFVMARVYSQLLHMLKQPPDRQAQDRSAMFRQNALKWLQTCIDTAKSLGAKALLGRTYFELGGIYQSAGNLDEAQDAYRKSVELFAQSDADGYLRQARERLADLNLTRSQQR